MTDQAQGTVVEILRGNVDDFRRHAGSLPEAHDDEVGTGLGPVDMDWKAYYVLEETGKLLILLAWANTVDLVGYACSFVYQDMIHSSVRFMDNHVIYVRPDFRTKASGWSIQSNYWETLGLRLIKETELRAREMECDLIRWNVNPGTAMHRILSRREYNQETIALTRVP